MSKRIPFSAWLTRRRRVDPRVAALVAQLQRVYGVQALPDAWNHDELCLYADDPRRRHPDYAALEEAIFDAYYDWGYFDKHVYPRLGEGLPG